VLTVAALTGFAGFEPFVEPDIDGALLVVVTVRGVPMAERPLQVTYRKGRAFAAYLHICHATGEKSQDRRIGRRVARGRLRKRGRSRWY
jgi:hypothetical protein